MKASKHNITQSDKPITVTSIENYRHKKKEKKSAELEIVPTCRESTKGTTESSFYKFKRLKIPIL
jgi:hypothetical protein